MNLKANVIERLGAVADRYDGHDAIHNPDARRVMVEWYSLGAIVGDCQTVVFSKPQAEVFARLDENYSERIDYELPFPQMLIEFSKPLEIDGEKLYGIALSEGDVDLDDYAKEMSARGMDMNNVDIGMEDGTVFHQGVGIFRERLESVLWQVTDRQTLFDNDDPSGIKNLAIACIGYINCENIELERQEPNAKINRKRVRHGKRELDPYYLCRIRGVEYGGSTSSPTEGSTHGIRYDVRGHFRRFGDGRMTWVRPHQRGVGNEVYVPKEYVV